MTDKTNDLKQWTKPVLVPLTAELRHHRVVKSIAAAGIDFFGSSSAAPPPPPPPAPTGS